MMHDGIFFDLSVLLFWPLAIGLISLVVPEAIARLAAIVMTIVPLVLWIALVTNFDNSRGSELQFVTDKAWIEELGISYKLGLDGLNLWLTGLTVILFFFAALWLAIRPTPRLKLLVTFVGVAQTAVLGAFIAQDLALFVVFFDLMLVPFFFIVGIWGGAERINATIKMVIYTLVGSLLMLAAAVATAVYTAQATGGSLSFDLIDLRSIQLGSSTQLWLFLAFALAFLIKMPAFPLHGWMPDVYTNMPVPVLTVFSGVLSKVATYGFLRFAIALFPAAIDQLQTPLLIAALCSIVYGSAQAFTQTSTRLIVGYSSIAQLGFILLGIFALQAEGTQGAVLQMINHGLVVAPLFFIIAVLIDRTGSDDLTRLSGMAFRAPVLATVFLIVALATLAMPGSANFVGEFLILLGLFESKMTVAIIAFLGVVMASVYMLRAFIRAMHNRPTDPTTSRELTFAEAIVIVPLALAIIAFAIYPQRALSDSARSSQAIVREHRLASKQAHNLSTDQATDRTR